MLQVGSVIDGKYRILTKVGSGGTSTVWLAINETANKQWAVKEIRRSGTVKGERIKQNLLTEIDILKKLDHPNLPSIIDVINEKDTFLILMDYIEGRTLKTLLEEKGAQPQDDVVDWAMQMCSVLSYLHSQDPPIIYRDIKPANIMLRPDGKAILIDFGAAREYKSGKDDDTICLGTRGYAAPEQYEGEGQTDPRTDIYNLGATMYHLVTGKNPAKPPYEIRAIREWDPSLSTGLEKIIKKCTATDPNDRYQSAEELRFALEHYRELDTSYMNERAREWKRVLAVAVLSVLCLAGSFITKAYARSLRSGTYDELLRRAQISADASDRASAYEEAARTDPVRGDAYELLLNEVFLADGEFSRDESDRMTSLLGYKGARDNKTNEDKLKGNREAYDRFCYDMGLAYFYYYGEDGNKQLSRTWFAEAKDSETLGTAQAQRAARFYKLTDYYIQLGSYNKAGDDPFSYKDYWTDLVSISSGDIVSQDNVRTALVVYKELTWQIGAHALEFRNAGISRNAMEAELQRAGKATEDIAGSGKADRETDARLIEQVRGNIGSAANILDTVFQDDGGEEADR